MMSKMASTSSIILMVFNGLHLVLYLVALIDSNFSGLILSLCIRSCRGPVSYNESSCGIPD